MINIHFTLFADMQDSVLNMMTSTLKLRGIVVCE